MGPPNCPNCMGTGLELTPGCCLVPIPANPARQRLCCRDGHTKTPQVTSGCPQPPIPVPAGPPPAAAQSPGGRDARPTPKLHKRTCCEQLPPLLPSAPGALTGAENTPTPFPALWAGSHNTSCSPAGAGAEPKSSSAPPKDPIPNPRGAQWCCPLLHHPAQCRRGWDMLGGGHTGTGHSGFCHTAPSTAAASPSARPGGISDLKTNRFVTLFFFPPKVYYY